MKRFRRPPGPGFEPAPVKAQDCQSLWTISWVLEFIQFYLLFKSPGALAYVAKNAHYLLHVCLSVSQPARINATSTGRIFGELCLPASYELSEPAVRHRVKIKLRLTLSRQGSERTLEVNSFHTFLCSSHGSKRRDPKILFGFPENF